MRSAVPLPSSWFANVPLSGDDSAVRVLLQDHSHPLREVVHNTPTKDGLLLAQAFREALGAHCVFTYPAEHGALHAAALLAAWIGVAPNSVHGDLGGTATIVRSGLGHRDDQKWHTDSTPWRQPNRFTLLGQVHLAEGFTAPATELLPFATVDQALVQQPHYLNLLRSTPVPWRRNFPGRPPLDAPILAADMPRWVGSVLDDSTHELPRPLQEAVCAFRSTIDSLPFTAAVVERGVLLLFDNYSNLHRGPQIEQDFERRLIRIKIGGTPE